MAGGAVAFPANKDYILQGDWLVDWRSGKHYAFDAPSDPPYTVIPTLTPDNRIITHIDTDKYDGTVIIDPIHDTVEYWKEAASVSVTPDNRHAIGLSTENYKCTLWRWPEKEKVGHCSPRLRGIFGKYPEHLEVVTLSRDGKSFAIGFGNNVWVYRIEPFQLEREATMPGSVRALALSNDGWLAVSDRKGFLRVWNINTGELAGQRRFFGNVLNVLSERQVPKLAFQPDGNKLFTAYGNLTVFELPRQTARPESESDPGTP